MKIAGVAGNEQADYVGKEDLNTVNSFHHSHHFYVLGNLLLLVVLCRGGGQRNTVVKQLQIY